MSIYFFEIPKAGLGISGGERCMLENVYHFTNKGIPCHIITTDNGKIVYEKFGIKEGDNIKYHVVDSFLLEKKVHIFFSYIARTFQALILVRKIDFKNEDVLICNTDFFPNSISFFAAALKNKSTRLIYWWRVMAPDIMKGFEGQFTGKYQLPRLNVINYKINQLVYKLSVLKRGIIVSPSRSYEEKLKKMFPSNKVYIFSHYGGFSLLEKNIGYHKELEKKHDIIWMGRFQKLKGIDKLVEIVKLLKVSKPDISVVILGGGSKRDNERIDGLIADSGLQENIVCRGFVYGDEKSALLDESRIFAMTSCFESFGQVIFEAMMHGLPVVAYDLPSFGVFEKGMLKVPIHDDSSYVASVSRLLDDGKLYELVREEGRRFASMFTWEKTGEELLTLIGKNE